MRGKRRSRLASNRRLAVLLLAVVAIGAAAIAITAYATNLLRSLDLNTVNTRFSIRGNERPPKNIVIVEVNDTTFQDLNVYPLPRRAYGRVIARIAAEHPAAIAVDIQFSEKSPGTSAAATNDEVALLNAIQAAHGTTVFSATEVGAHGNVPFLGSAEGAKLLHEVGSRPADTQFSPAEPGGFDRQFSYSVLGLPTFAVVTAEVATHKHISQAQFGGGANWIDFVGPGGTFPAVSFSDVYYPHRLAPTFFRDKIVVIGDTSTTDQDFHPTSTDPHMPGVEVQANAINTVLRGNPLSSAPGPINVILILLLAAAVPLASLRLGPVAATALAVALGAVFTVAVQLAFNSGVIVSFIYPLGALILSAGGSLSAQLVTEASERIRVRDLFSRFVPEDVVDEVLASADGLRLGGVQRDGTVMFADLRGFTTLAESLTPARVIEVLNRYLSEMSDAILDHGGTLVAYMGDGIMAVFGAPLEQADHADRGLAAAREMLEVRLPRFNEWLRAEGISEGFRMGIGLNSGHVMSGHVGSERRVEYAAVGDTTNSAARIEQLTKGTPHQLLLSGATKDALVSPPEDLIEVGETEIRGRVGGMTLWSLPEVSVDARLEPLQVPGPAA
jgi:adenylate cyclase